MRAASGRLYFFLTSGVSWIVPMPDFRLRAGRIQCTHSPFIHAIAYSTLTAKIPHCWAFHEA